MRSVGGGVRATDLFMAISITVCATSAVPADDQGSAQTFPPATDTDRAKADSLLDAERAFCHLVEERGIRTGFLAVLDTSAVVFRPGPVDARQWYAARDTIAGILSWQPAFVQASGDLGFTTGPWQYRPKSMTEEPIAYGEYVSVWTRAARNDGGGETSVEPGRGSWRLLLDLGISHARPSSTANETPMFGVANRPWVGPQKNPGGPASAQGIRGARERLLEIDRPFGRTLSPGNPATFYEAYTGNASRLLRGDHPPASGRGAFLDQLADSVALVSWAPREAGVSCWLDLGYTWGEARLVRKATPGDTITTHYLRTWRRVPSLDDKQREWQIVIECILEPR
jgi:hypothetical protein